MEAHILRTFEKIYEDESDAIVRFCLVRVSDREQALDIAQETFFRLWNSLVQGKEILNHRAFLFTVAHHLVIDWYRKKKTLSLEDKVGEDGESEYDPSDGSTVEVLELGAEGRYLLSKINELSPMHRHVVYLRFIEGLSPQEIGQILGISANTASVRVNRGLQELRKRTGYNY